MIYNYLNLCFNTTNVTQSTYPRMMTFNDTCQTGNEAHYQLAKGDAIKVLLVYNASTGYYNGYTILHGE